MQRNAERPQQVFRSDVALPVCSAQRQNLGAAFFQSGRRVRCKTPRVFVSTKIFPPLLSVEPICNREELVIFAFVAATFVSIDLDEGVAAFDRDDRFQLTRSV